MPKNDHEATVGLHVTDTEIHDFHMTLKDIESNMIKFGKHPELIKAKKALEALFRQLFPV